MRPGDFSWRPITHSQGSEHSICWSNGTEWGVEGSRSNLWEQGEGTDNAIHWRLRPCADHVLKSLKTLTFAKYTGPRRKTHREQQNIFKCKKNINEKTKPHKSEQDQSSEREQYLSALVRDYLNEPWSVCDYAAPQPWLASLSNFWSFGADGDRLDFSILRTEETLSDTTEESTPNQEVLREFSWSFHNQAQPGYSLSHLGCRRGLKRRKPCPLEVKAESEPGGWRMKVSWCLSSWLTCIFSCFSKLEDIQPV